MKLPSGSGTPAADASDALAEATAACRAISSLTAEVGVTGSIAGRRTRARLLVGLAAPASARIEAFAYSQLVFIFVARDNDATLLLTREGRALEHAPPAEVLEAITGVPVDAAQLRETLTGCAFIAGAAEGRQLGDDWRVVTRGASVLYLRRESSAEPWRLVATVHRPTSGPEWRAEYLDFENGLPQTVRLVSRDTRRFGLRLALSQGEINATLEPVAFAVKIPPSTDRLTIQELRERGPLAVDAR